MKGAAQMESATPTADTGLWPVEICAICSGGSFRSYAEAMYRLDGVSLDLARCLGCGFVFVTPRPSADRLKRLYATEDYYERDYTLGVSQRSYFARREELLRHYDGVVRRFDHDGLPSGRRFFEVGAAGGFLLEAARRRGFQSSGVEISPFAAEYAAREFGLDVKVGDIGDVEIDPESQDIVYVDNILEHTIDPIRVLRRLRRILVAGGLLVVIVPTYVASIYFRWLKGLRHTWFAARIGTGLGSLLKVSGGEEALPYHIDEFSRASLMHALAAAGFRIERSAASVPIPEEPGSPLMGTAFRAADALMRMGILPGARLEVHARPIPD